MAKVYYVKTRNFNCQFWLWLVLAIATRLSGGKVSKHPRDFDGKFWLHTCNRDKAVSLAAFYKRMAPWSGGITYFEEEA